MPLPTSGTITLNEIHVEAGGGSGTQASLEDADIRALIGKASGASNSFSEYYGASSASPIIASGGTVTTSGGFRYHRFTSSGTFSISQIATGSISNSLTVFLCGGGGGGASYIGGGGGGAMVRLNSVAATTGNKSVTIGSGGANAFGSYPYSAQGATGGTTYVSGFGLSGANGGTGGYNRYTSLATRQHGGNSGNGRTGGTDLYGNDDGSSGGGAGFGANGGNGTSFYSAGSGGAGYNLSGFTASTSVTQFAGGGGGVAFAANVYRSGGSGVYGGGNGTQGGNSNATPNQGGGGGGNDVSTAGNGGSGIVIIKYAYP